MQRKFGILSALAACVLMSAAADESGLGASTGGGAQPDEKAALKAAKDAEKAAAKLAEKEAKAAAAAQKKADEKAAKEAAAAAKKAEKEANRMPEQNGVRRPKPETLCGQAWALFDSLSASGPTAISPALEKAKELGLNEGNVKTEYSRWRKYFGVTGRIEDPAAAQKKAEKEAEAAAQKQAKADAKAAEKAEKKAAADAKKAQEKAEKQAAKDLQKAQAAEAKAAQKAAEEQAKNQA